ncbi:hypothetical protein F4776DRAFT_657262 [Hypoxylon sp. NC0597]|nr:hypothetical protein F4776DRAFT_657262 [Hypoxylon sp. NC0597]
MVFPSRGCITCKQRRIKCDSVHPTCGRCQKASRECIWDQNEEAGLLFKSENAFAQGKPRRPWKPRERDVELAEVVATPSASDSLSDSPTSPVLFPQTEDEAFRFWVENYVFRNDEIPEFAREYSHYVTAYRDKARPDSSLRLAVSAVSHAVLGRARKADTLIEDAEKLFSQSIIKMRSEFHELTQDNIDELLVTTMLMALYENIMYGDERHHSQRQGLSSDPDIIGSRFWEKVCHHEGAAGLLKLRQEHGWTANLALERAARRQLIRTCILRGIPEAPWLEDGTQFGEEGPMLELDKIMVRVASLRERSLYLFLPKSARFSSQPLPGHIATEAQDLDAALESWTRDLPEDWRFSTQSDSTANTTFDGLIHTYPSHGHGAIWNRYFAVHIIVNSIRRRALSVMAQCSSQTMSTRTEQNICQEKIASLATDLCRGIPFFIASHIIAQGSPSPTRVIKIGSNVIHTNYEILPKLATLLAWPLALAVSTETVPEPQKQYLKIKLESVANALGDSALQSVAEQEEFKF